MGTSIALGGGKYPIPYRNSYFSYIVRNSVKVCWGTAMTDPERQALNERIALRLGWQYKIPCGSKTKTKYWKLPSPRPGKINWFEHPPDYTRDWEHAGPLLIELYRNNWRLCYGSEVFWMESGTQTTWDDGYAEEAPEAIALAFDARKETDA